MLAFLPSQIIERLSSAGIPLETNVIEKASRIVGIRDLANLASFPDARTIVDSWLAFLNAKVDDDELTDRAVVLLLSFFVEAFRRDRPWSSGVQAELRPRTARTGKSMTISGCWFEARRRLAGRLFHYGRRGTISAEKQAALRASISEYNALLAIDAGAQRPELRRRYFGMRGVAALFLGRLSETALPLYQAAAADLEEASAAGDYTSQHFEYLIEAYLHQYEITSDATILERAAAALNQATHHNSQTRGLACLAGLIALHEGAVSLRHRNRTEAVERFKNAIDSLGSALLLPPHRSFADDFLRLNRAVARVRLAILRADESHAEQLLTDAIDELRDVSAGEHDSDFRSLWLPVALVRRGLLRNKAGDRVSALNDIADAESHVLQVGTVFDPAILRRQVELARHEIELNVAVEREDCEAVASSLRWWVTEWSTSEPLPVAALALALRWLSTAAESLWSELVPSVTLLFRASAARDGEPASARRFTLSHAANAMRVLGKRTGNAGAFRESHALYVEAIEAESTPAPTEFYAYAGEVALRLAKDAEQNAGSAIRLLEDAAGFLSAALAQMRGNAASGEMTQVVACSRAGEAFARLYSQTNDNAHAELAIAYLTEAMSLGNRTAHLLGFLGDLYFRRGRFRRDTNDLERAVHLKNEARDAENASSIASWRENRSIAANASFQLWHITRDPRQLMEAITAAAESAAADSNWAWPLLQLAETASTSVHDRDSARATAAGIPEPLAALALDGQSETLMREACRIAVENRSAFSLRELSGRNVVYSFDDPHGLLSSTLVVKETSNAMRELNTVAGFRAFLDANSSPSWMLLPEPLSVLVLGGKTSYVMRRIAGDDLDLAVTQRRRTGESPVSLIRKATLFLARYHAWRGERPSTSPNALRDDSSNALNRFVRHFRVSPVVADEMRRYLERIVNARLSLLAKKDAHAENWIVTPNQQIAMIDLEATRSLPLFYEMAQLIEDHGLLTCDEEGWRWREELVHEYLNELRQFVELSCDERANGEMIWYAGFALVRALTNLPLVGRRHITRTTESSVVRAREQRATHYVQLIESIQMRCPNDSVNAFARVMIAEIRREDESIRLTMQAAEESLPLPALALPVG